MGVCYKNSMNSREGISIHLTSPKRGSNPGGTCTIQTPTREFQGYIKYCNVSRVSPYTADHQPLYEALTSTLARMLGLKVPAFWIVDNRGKDVDFTYDPDIPQLNEEKPFYFISRIVGHKLNDQHPNLGAIMHEEKFYRDLLHLGDISGRPQNYSYYTKNTPEGKEEGVIYLDLGCAFNDAHEGALTRRRKAEPRHFKPKELRSLKKKAANHRFQTRRGGKIHFLEDIAQTITTARIPVIGAQLPHRAVLPLNKVLSQEELDELQNTFYSNLTQILKVYRDQFLK